jgi:hypothetical protein
MRTKPPPSQRAVVRALSARFVDVKSSVSGNPGVAALAGSTRKKTKPTTMLNHMQ